MAIIVDKIQKRKDIALSCKKIFFQNSINDLTISQIAKTAGIGKGTIYEYFKNKEDIIFEIVNILIVERSAKVEKRINKIQSTKNKIKEFSRFFYSQEDKELRQLYKEFISITLANPDDEMIEFQTTCTNTHFVWLQSMLQDGIQKGELKENSLDFARGMFCVGEGMFIASVATTSIDDLEKEINQFIDAIFESIEVKV